jgi:flagellar protein FliO/FliZ
MRVNCGKTKVSGRPLTWIPVFLLVMTLKPSTVPAQDPFSGALATSPASSQGIEETETAPASSRGPDLVRVPPPSGHHARFSLGANSAEKEEGSASSRSWWLGSTGIALVLAVCGAICLAARKYRPHDSAGLVQVVGRISLTSRHSIFVVRVGRRSLLIGTGAQGSPTLLGELTEADQAGTSADSAPACLSRNRARADGSHETWSQGTMPAVNIRLEEEE